MDVVPRWGTGPDHVLLDDWGENPQTLAAGRRAVVLSGPAHGPGGTWVRAWITWDPANFPGDYFAWLPVTVDGQVALRHEVAPTCPAKATVDAIGALAPFDRLRCFGTDMLTFEAESWLPAVWPVYDTDPAWYGTSADNRRTVSVFGGGARARPPDRSIPWLDVRTPPEVPVPPPDFIVRVSGQFDHPSAASCRRTLNRVGWNPAPPPGAGVPIEAADDSVLWCRSQFVVSDWDVVQGPERRPVDPARPQLHRIDPPPPGVPVACGGVGMPPLVVRIDPTALDPVWLEPGGLGRSLVFFGPEFRLEPGPPAQVTGPANVVLRDGDVVDPDRGRPGLEVCPGGEVVTFTAGT
jgi:hypothetical protein